MSKRVSRTFRVHGLDSALDSEIAVEVLARAREDCAYHRAKSCRIDYTEEIIIAGYPNILTIGTFTCYERCGKIIQRAVHDAEEFLTEAFEGTEVKVSINGHLDIPT